MFSRPSRKVTRISRVTNLPVVALLLKLLWPLRVLTKRILRLTLKLCWNKATSHLWKQCWVYNPLRFLNPQQIQLWLNFSVRQRGQSFWMRHRRRSLKDLTMKHQTCLKQCCCSKAILHNCAMSTTDAVSARVTILRLLIYKVYSEITRF